MTATRVLTVLELLQTHGRISGAEIADRTGVDRRTVRRYIATLEEIGVPVTTVRGPLGGYELVAGYKLPPLMFTNEEALAVALGLAAVRGLGLTATAHAVTSGQAKLERVMPANLRERVRSISESVEFAPVYQTGSGAGESLSILSTAAHRRTGVHLRYRAPPGEESERDFDPFGLAFRNGRWYVAGYCHLRNGLRSFRLDRVTAVIPQERKFTRPEGFDVTAHLSASIALLPRKFAVEVVLETDLESARQEIFQAIGVLEPTRGGVRLYSQVDDLDWFARELSRLPWPFAVIAPAGLRDAVRAHSLALLRQAKRKTLAKVQ